MDEKKNILTYEGLRKYEDELHELKVVRRKEVAEKIKEARENGEICYLERVQNTHLSQLQALNWLNKNKGVDSQFLFIHQHQDKEENNG